MQFKAIFAAIRDAIRLTKSSFRQTSNVTALALFAQIRWKGLTESNFTATSTILIGSLLNWPQVLISISNRINTPLY